MMNERSTVLGAPAERILTKLGVDACDLVSLCMRLGIDRLFVFGSALREDFSSQSDVDLVADFAPDARVSVFGHMDVEKEFSALLGRRVDLITEAALTHSRNALLRDEVLSTRSLLYAR